MWLVPPMPGDAPDVLAEGLGRPRGLAALRDGRVLLTDRQNHTVHVLDPATGALSLLAGTHGAAGYRDGTGTAARFDSPYGCAALPDGSMLVADLGNRRVRRVTLDGKVTTYAGSGVGGTWDGPRLAARFDQPGDVAVDDARHAYVADRGARRVRRITVGGLVETLAGDGTAGFSDGPGAAARFYGIEAIEVVPSGQVVYVTDSNQGEGAGVPYHRIRRLAVP